MCVQIALKFQLFWSTTTRISITVASFLKKKANKSSTCYVIIKKSK